jgi:hypothetical protein
VQPSGPRIVGILGALRDDAYTEGKHTLRGKQAQRDVARGREVHVFEDGVDLLALEERVWTEGIYLGQVGKGHRAAFDRFVWHSPQVVGRRIKAGQADIPLSWVEVKGKIVKGVWVYHLVPRSKPAS